MADATDDQTAGSAAGQTALQRAPLSTYRLQLRSDFGLNAVHDLLPYLRRLGVSDVYLSPLFRARRDSSHGYDVVDHGVIDPAFGTINDFAMLAKAVRGAEMGILLDVVPNHMGINDPANAWWLDVLEHGEKAEHADFFDIDWRPAAEHLRHKVLLPFLGEPFGETLESGKLQLVYERQRLQIAYGDKRFPVARETWPQELAELIESTDDDFIRRGLFAWNGRVGDPGSFDRLEEILDAQPYRLASWRVAADEINYRRFFDINDLAAIRVEDPRVFAAVHRLVARFLEEGLITGLRIDHPDGLWDPEAYFQQLQSLFAKSGHASAGDRLYVVAEKILAGDESLPADWAVSGTTGYDFLNIVSRLFVSAPGLATLRANYARLTGEDDSAATEAYLGKREVLSHALASELSVLANRLTRIAQQDRASRDFTRRALERALREVIACLPVYRTYMRPRGWDVTEADFRQISSAVRWAKRRNPGAAHAEFDFIGQVLRLEHPPWLTPEQADARRQFVLKLQQVTGPAMAKGLEDTAFYRYYPLASLNEVGGELAARPLDPEAFHLLMARRASDWPHSMSASGTHDAKRGEDFRARLHVLSEIADDWIATVERWQELTRPLWAEVEGDAAPDRNELYLLFQTLVGTWPADEMNDAERFGYCERIENYMQKALREAKRHTSWISPSAIYESTVTTFVRSLVVDDVGAEFRQELAALADRITIAGYINGLSQVLLKSLLPGVPDFYQGSEFWDFNLVDPDNRRPVDFSWREHTLAELERRYLESPAALAAELDEHMADDRTKQFVTWRALTTRANLPAVVQRGAYVPLTVTGEQAAHAFAFARVWHDQWIAVVVPREIQCLLDDEGVIAWGDTAVVLPQEVAHWRSELTRQRVSADGRLADLLRPLPIALLTSQAD